MCLCIHIYIYMYTHRIHIILIPLRRCFNNCSSFQQLLRFAFASCLLCVCFLICFALRYFQLIKAHCDTTLINKPAAVRQLNGSIPRAATEFSCIETDQMWNGLKRLTPWCCRPCKTFLHEIASGVTMESRHKHRKGVTSKTTFPTFCTYPLAHWQN